MKRRRDLSEEEAALWRGVARSITPLRSAQAAGRARLAGEAGARPQRTVTPQQSPPPAKPPSLSPLERRFKQRLGRGRDAIDVRIDLHGMTQREAHDALIGFLHRAQCDGARTALIVTGKGTAGKGTTGDGLGPRQAFSERGVLRRQVPMWLALPEFRRYVAGFDTAHVSHGGEGALYVRLRRPR